MSPENQKILWQHYYGTLAKGVDVGYNPTVEMYDPALAHSLKYDIAKFSAFKETSFRKQLESALTKNGKVVPWSEFKKNADVLNTQYNRQWLKTEYNHTVATANMAQQWQGFEADKDLYPNLRYNAVGDGRTREQHKAWDGLILPIEHVFWKSHLPPNDWGCRCNVEQTDDKPTVEMPEILIKGAFNNNAALSGKVFAEVPYASGLSSAENSAIEKVAKENFNEIKTEYKNYSIDQLKEVYKTQNIDKLKESIIMKDGYVASGNAFSINEKLRNSLDLSDRDNKTVDALDDLIKANKLKDNVILYRNVKNDFVKNMFKVEIDNLSITDAINKIKSTGINKITDKAFFSTSAVKTANAFMARKVHLEVLTKKGTNALIVDNYSESEIILGRNQKFKIVDVVEDNNKIKVILETD